MTVLEMINAIRHELDDRGGDTGPAPTGFTYFWESDDAGCLWKNESLVYFLNAAGNELGLRRPLVAHHEAEADITRVSLMPGTATYPLDPVVLAVDAVFLQSSGLPLIKIADAQVRSVFADPHQVTFKDPSGVESYRTDLDKHTITVQAPPTVADTLRLTVKHLPMGTFSWAQRKTQTSEFSPHYDQALVEWACSMAFRKRDADTFDSEASDKYRGLFTDRVGPRIDFNHAAIRQEVAGRRLRTTAYY